jgi:HEAT repeat protein
LSALSFIWWLSLILAGAAIATTVILVLVRLFTARRRVRWVARRRELVRQLLGGNPAANAELGRLPPALVADAFVELIRLVRGDERTRFVDQAGTFGVPRQLARQLRRGSARQRFLAAHALAQFGDDDSVSALRQAVGDGNPKVRLAAALSLAESGHAGNIRELVRDLRLGSDEASTLAVTIFQSASASGPEDIKSLILAPETNAGVRMAAIEALVASGDYSVVPVIANLALGAPDDAPELPRYLRALGLLGHPAARPAVVQGLASAAYAARAAAAEAAGRIGIADAADQLARLLDDEEWWVRFRAAEALLKLGPDGVERLRDAVREGSPRASSAAASMLAENKMPE